MGVLIYSPISLYFISQESSTATSPKPIATLHHLSKKLWSFALTITHHFINLFIRSTFSRSVFSVGFHLIKSSFHTAGNILAWSISTIAIAIFILLLLQFFQGESLGCRLPKYISFKFLIFVSKV